MSYFIDLFRKEVVLQPLVVNLDEIFHKEQDSRLFSHVIGVGL